MLACWRAVAVRCDFEPWGMDFLYWHMLREIHCQAAAALMAAFHAVPQSVTRSRAMRASGGSERMWLDK
ncbi:MAG: hypothetical protein ACI83P_000656 [Janthinobacterium sp.]|jgi:hypothetical protein